MAAAAKSTSSKAEDKPPAATEPDAGDPSKAENTTPAAEQQPNGAERLDAMGKPTDCVVDDGTTHMGRALGGTVVCSAHTNRYRNDGTPREPLATGGRYKTKAG